jgi:hypothetical protein
MASAKRDTKERNAQWKKEKAEKAPYFAAAASASSKKVESSEDEFDKKAFMKCFIESWTTSQKNKKSQKNKRKRSDNDTSDSESNYLQSFDI